MAQGSCIVLDPGVSAIQANRKVANVVLDALVLQLLVLHAGSEELEGLVSLRPDVKGCLEVFSHT